MEELLYFDLDVVIVNNIDWIWQLPTTQFWTVRDFKYLWKPSNYSVNSSIMYWDTKRFKQVWNNFKKQQFGTIISSYRGDQDYITEVIAQQDLRFFDIKSIQSWRWQALDGGYNFGTRRYFTPGTGTKIAPDTSVLVFHGNPKPDAVQDPAIINNWR